MSSSMAVRAPPPISASGFLLVAAGQRVQLEPAVERGEQP